MIPSANILASGDAVGLTITVGQLLSCFVVVLGACGTLAGLLWRAANKVSQFELRMQKLEFAQGTIQRDQDRDDKDQDRFETEMRSQVTDIFDNVGEIRVTLASLATAAGLRTPKKIEG